MSEDNVSQIVALCRAALATHLKHPSELAPRSNGEADAVTAFNCEIFAENDLFARGREWTLAQHIFQRLGHMYANPSKVEESAALKKAYTYSGSVGSGGRRHGRRTIANDSAPSVRAFVDDILDAARRHHKIRREGATFQVQEVPKGFILHGARGIGKTFFYNFVISRFDYHFDEPDDQAIWIRLNLADPLYDADLPTFGTSNLMEWIYGQAAKIVLRYYDVGSDYVRRGKVIHFAKRPFEALSEHMLPLDPNAALKLDRIQTAFMRKQHDDILTSSLIPIEYSQFLYNYAQECGYAMVIVFDGLDVLETTYNWVGKFRRIFNAVKAIYRSDDLLGAVFVSIMRTNSLRQHGNPYGAGTVPVYEIVAPKLDEIVDQRIALLKEEVPHLAQNTYRHWNADELFNGWPGHLDDFVGFLYSDEEGEGSTEGRLLQEIMEDDRRAQMQAIKLRYLEFLGRRAEPRYRLIETMMKVGMAYPPVHYRYQIASRKLQRLAGDQIRGDLRFFPSIFRVPYVGDAPNSEFKLPEEALLTGIRLLQIAECHGQIRSREPRLDYPLQIESLAHLTSVLFDCPHVLVVNLIEEYVDFQLFRTYGRFEPRSESTVTDDVSLMPKGRYLLSTALFDIAYLNLASMRAVLGRSAFDGVGKVPFVRAERFDPEAENGLETWVLAKILNSISICRLVTAVNTIQRRSFHQRVSKLKLKEKPLYDGIVREFLSGKIFDDIDRMSDRILRRMEPLIRSVFLPEHRYNVAIIEEGLSDYIRDWC